MRNTTTPYLAAAALCLVAILGACSSDDGPTAPGGGVVPPGGGGGGGGAGTFTITVTATPPVLNTGTVTSERSTIVIRVRRTDNGAPPPNGTTAVVTASQGEFIESGASSAVVTLVNGEATLTFLPEPGSTGTAVIRAELSGSVGQFSIELQQLGDAVFVLSHVEPNVVDPAGGQRITIFGQNFREPVRVTIDGRDAEVVSVANDRVRVVVPPRPTAVGAADPVNLTVTVGYGSELEASDTLSQALIYAHGGTISEPRIFSFSPTTGPSNGGTRLRIIGSGFVLPVQVLFVPSTGRIVEGELLSVTASEIQVLSPPVAAYGGAGGQVTAQIEVVNLSSGFRSGPSTQVFAYSVPVLITAIAPGAGPASGGTLVTIYGQGFVLPVAVSIDGVGQQVISVTGTEILFRTVPQRDLCSDGGGEVQVVNIDTGASSQGGPDFEFIGLAPTIFGLSPASGPSSGGTAVTISGQGFLNPVRVQFGEQTAASASANGSGTAVTTTAPPFTGELNSVACDDNADGTQGERYVPTSVDVTVINLGSDQCEDTLTNAFTYNPTDTSCRGDVGPTDPPEPVLPQCSDGIDNDGDGLTDYNGGVSPPGDPECQSDGDDDESA